MGDEDGERRELEACISTKPDYGVAYIYLAKNLMDTQGDLQKAAQLAEQGIEKSKEQENQILGNYLLADLLNRLGHPHAVVVGRDVGAAGRRRLVVEDRPTTGRGCASSGWRWHF